MKLKSTSILGFCLTSIMLASACATVPPPKELVDARAAYQRAQSAPGVELSPVPLYAAKGALDDAEQAFTAEGQTPRTRALSYVADRKARLSQAESGWARAGKMETQARADAAAFQTQALADTKQGLSDANNQLGRTQDALNMTAEQLAAEKLAREAADKRTHDALSKLALAASLAVKEEARGTVIVLPGNILFASGKSALLTTAQTKLSAVADALKEPGERKIVVEGHTDSQGSPTSNMQLGTDRAESVKNYLISRGVSPSSISATGIGEGRPIADNTTPEGRSDNRRVEIVVSNVESR